MYHALQQVDSTAAIFPEMLHSLIIVNAPGFFSFFWSIISRLLDAKTKSIIEIYSSPEKGRQRLLQLIDEKELPCDYGGQAPATSDIILREGRAADNARVPHRQVVQLLHLGGSSSHKDSAVTFVLESDEQVEWSIYTRCTGKAQFTLTASSSSRNTNDTTTPPLLHQKEIHHTTADAAADRHAACFDLGKTVTGPGTFTLAATMVKDGASSSSSTSSGKPHFLVIGEVFRV